MTTRELTMQGVDYYNNSVLRARVAGGLVGPGRASFNGHHPYHARPPPSSAANAAAVAAAVAAANGDALYRSNSSLDLTPDHALYSQHGGTGGALRREYGSHGSIDVVSTQRLSPGAPGPVPSTPTTPGTGESFFAMLRDYRPAVLSSVTTDQRSPGPAGYLRGKVDSTPSSDNATNILTSDDTSAAAPTNGSAPDRDRERSGPASSSPKLRLKLHRFWKADETSPSVDVPDGANTSTMSAIPTEPDERRRRAFAHYDCQSISANLGYAARLRGLLLARRRNTTTGASAASMLGQRAATPDSPSSDVGAGSSMGANSLADEDIGDGNSNHLIESCPYFRNEVGGEGERIVSLTRPVAGTTTNNPSSSRSPLHRPPLACGVSVLEFPPSETHWKNGSCPYQRPASAIESVDQGALYYRRFFYGQEHQNWFGMDENLGPVAASVKRELVERPAGSTSDTNNAAASASASASAPTSQPVYQYRLLIRTSELLTLRGSILEDAIPGLKSSGNARDNKTMNTKEVLEYVAPEMQLSCLRLGIAAPQTEEQLLKLDEQGLSNHYKVGIMYCKAGQGTEEEMYNNEDAGPAFQEFLETIGQRVRLKGFEKYKAGLDNKTDSTGLYSIYAQYQDCEIMFHVSTLLPFTPNNRQQLLRKRHIGNDIVTIVFQEPGAQPFTPKNIRSQFQHVFIVVRAINPCSENTQYSVAVTRSKEVGVFGPPIKENATYPKGKPFLDFLLAKVINAETAAHRSEKFATMATRTRQEYLKDLANNYTVTTLVKSGQKFSMLSFSSKKSREKEKEKEREKERERVGARPFRFLPDATQRGALCWQVVLEDSGQSALVDCFLAISADSLVLIEERTCEIVFVTPCASILGWATQGNSLRLYHHQGECTRMLMRESRINGLGSELSEVLLRLRSVTPGSVAQDLTLRRNNMGQLGFHVQPDGVVTQVENCGLAWQAGLRQGARLVEICKVAVSTLTHDQMVDLLKTSILVTVTVIPPLPDGSPRRGCTLNNCKYNAGNYESDYENLANAGEDGNLVGSNGLPTLPNNKNSSRKGNAGIQQAVPGNHRRRYDRNFSPPRSSNSSGYGTGSSSKSFTGVDRFPANTEGTMTGSLSGHSGDDRWYELLEPSDVSEPPAGDSPPPPLPARLNGSAFHNILPNGKHVASSMGSAYHAKVQASHSMPLPQPSYSLRLTGSQSVNHPVLKVGDRGRGVKGEGRLNGEARLRRDRTGKADYMLASDMSKSVSLPVECGDLRVISLSDTHSNDSSISDRLCGVPSEEDLSGSSSSVSPGMQRGKSSVASNTPTPISTSRNQSPRPRDAGEARLRSGVTQRSAHRLSANLHNSTLQEDLMRLINPDYMAVEDEPSSKVEKSSSPSGKVHASSTGSSCCGGATNNGMPANTPDNLVHAKSRSRENLCGSSSSVLEPSPANGPHQNGPSSVQNDQLGRNAPPSEVILTTARPATVISNASTASSPAPSENKLTKEERLSPWVTKPPSGVGQKSSTALSPLPLPDAHDMDWPSLVDTATRAMLTVSDSSESIDQGVASSGGVNSLPSADNEPLAHWVDNVAERLGLDTGVLQTTADLQRQLSMLQNRLSQETNLRLSLEQEVRHLRDENRRLHDESQAAAQQLRRFTEWFFQTIDRQ